MIYALKKALNGVGIWWAANNKREHEQIKIHKYMEGNCRASKRRAEAKAPACLFPGLYSSIIYC